MNLKDVILNCNQYEDSDELVHMVFAKKSNDKFESYSEAMVLPLTLDEMEMRQIDISNSKCPGFVYFLEMSIIQGMFADMISMEEYKSDDVKVNRIIHYAEFDA